MSTPSASRWVFCVLLACGALCPVLAQTPGKSPSAHIEEVLRSVSRVHSLAQVAISPDGKRLAWIQDGEIFAAPLENIEKGQRVTASAGEVDWKDCTEHDLAWSPDSTALA